MKAAPKEKAASTAIAALLGAKRTAKPKETAVAAEPKAEGAGAAGAAEATTAPQIMPKAGGAPTFPTDAVMCHDCGSACHKYSARVYFKTHKGGERWRCNCCRTKITQLYKSRGKWPPVGFGRASLDERQGFMRSIKDLNGEDSAVKADMFLKTYEMHQKKYSHGGVYWPLQKWAHEGYDTDAIEKLSQPEDIQHHDVLGKCYRVKFLEKSEEGTQGSEKGDNIHGAEKANKLIAALATLIEQGGSSAGSQEGQPSAADGADGGEKPRDSVSCSSDSSKSSSSSSSSSKGKKSKKSKKAKKKKKEQKKAKKAKKEKEAVEKKKRKMHELEKDQERAKKNVAKVIASPHKKVVERTKEIGPLLLDSHFSMLPKSYQDEAVKCHAALQLLDQVYEKAVGAEQVPKEHNTYEQVMKDSRQIAQMMKGLYRQFGAF